MEGLDKLEVISNTFPTGSVVTVLLTTKGLEIIEIRPNVERQE